MNTIHYKNGNVLVSIAKDGTKIREWEGEPKLIYPESIDCKITNYCDLNCPWCHEKSNTSGKHADIETLLEVMECLPPGVEIACLSGDTICYNDNGAVEIRDLKVGDKIFDSDNRLSTIVDITKTKKQTIKLIGNKGFEIKSSKDHPFMVGGTQVKAIDLQNQSLDLVNSTTWNTVGYAIDLSPFITKPTNIGKKGGSVGGKITNDKIRLNHKSPWIPKRIMLTEDLMWFYGLTVAEGSKKGLSLNKSEINLANKASDIYYSLFKISSAKYEKNNSLTLEFKSPFVFETLMFKAMKIGYGARNKSLSFLFSINDINLIRAALFGLFEGDGAFRKRNIRKFKSFNLTYKTSSKKIAYELLYLLKRYFNISASIYYGMNPKRFIEGRELKPSDYYKIDIYNKEDISNLFPSLFCNDLDFKKIGKSKFSTRTKVSDLTIKSIQSVKSEELYDITLDSGSSHIFPVNGYVLTHNCGGGNPFSHPHLIQLLNELSDRGLIANITVNQKHILTYSEMIRYLLNEELIHGLGISVTDVEHLSDIEPILRLTDNIVFHVIMGINPVDVVDKLEDFCWHQGKGCKVLVLGYKAFGRGSSFLQKHSSIEDNKYQWYIGIAKHFKRQGLVLSFDNLALEQLNLSRFFTRDAWDRFYMGDDGFATCYIDAVNQQYAISSTSPNRVYFHEMSLIDFFQNISRPHTEEE